MPKAKALEEAKHWLRNLTSQEVDKLVKDLPGPARGEIGVIPAAATTAEVRRFEHPYYWAGFILIGDPN